MIDSPSERDHRRRRDEPTHPSLATQSGPAWMSHPSMYEDSPGLDPSRAAAAAAAARAVSPRRSPLSRAIPRRATSGGVAASSPDSIISSDYSESSSSDEGLWARPSLASSFSPPHSRVEQQYSHSAQQFWSPRSGRADPGSPSSTARSRYEQRRGYPGQIFSPPSSGRRGPVERSSTASSRLEGEGLGGYSAHLFSTPSPGRPASITRSRTASSRLEEERGYSAHLFSTPGSDRPEPIRRSSTASSKHGGASRSAGSPPIRGILKRSFEEGGGRRDAGSLTPRFGRGPPSRHTSPRPSVRFSVDGSEFEEAGLAESTYLGALGRSQGGHSSGLGRSSPSQSGGSPELGPSSRRQGSGSREPDPFNWGATGLEGGHSRDLSRGSPEVYQATPLSPSSLGELSGLFAPPTRSQGAGQLASPERQGPREHRTTKLQPRALGSLFQMPAGMGPPPESPSLGEASHGGEAGAKPSPVHERIQRVTSVPNFRRGAGTGQAELSDSRADEAELFARSAIPSASSAASEAEKTLDKVHSQLRSAFDALAAARAYHLQASPRRIRRDVRTSADVRPSSADIKESFSEARMSAADIRARMLAREGLRSPISVDSSSSAEPSGGPDTPGPSPDSFRREGVARAEGGTVRKAVRFSSETPQVYQSPRSSEASGSVARQSEARPGSDAESPGKGEESGGGKGKGKGRQEERPRGSSAAAESPSKGERPDWDAKFETFKEDEEVAAAAASVQAAVAAAATEAEVAAAAATAQGWSRRGKSKGKGKGKGGTNQAPALLEVRIGPPPEWVVNAEPGEGVRKSIHDWIERLEQFKRTLEAIEKPVTITPVSTGDLVEVVYRGESVGRLEAGRATYRPKTGDTHIDAHLGKVLSTVSDFYFAAYFNEPSENASEQLGPVQSEGGSESLVNAGSSGSGAAMASGGAATDTGRGEDSEKEEDIFAAARTAGMARSQSGVPRKSEESEGGTRAPRSGLERARVTRSFSTDSQTPSEASESVLESKRVSKPGSLSDFEDSIARHNVRQRSMASIRRTPSITEQELLRLQRKLRSSSLARASLRRDSEASSSSSQPGLTAGAPRPSGVEPTPESTVHDAPPEPLVEPPTAKSLATGVMGAEFGMARGHVGQAVHQSGSPGSSGATSAVPGGGEGSPGQSRGSPGGDTRHAWSGTSRPGQASPVSPASHASSSPNAGGSPSPEAKGNSDINVLSPGNSPGGGTEGPSSPGRDGGGPFVVHNYSESESRNGREKSRGPGGQGRPVHLSGGAGGLSSDVPPVVITEIGTEPRPSGGELSTAFLFPTITLVETENMPPLYTQEDLTPTPHFKPYQPRVKPTLPSASAASPKPMGSPTPRSPQSNASPAQATSRASPAQTSEKSSPAQASSRASPAQTPERRAAAPPSPVSISSPVTPETAGSVSSDEIVPVGPRHVVPAKARLEPAVWTRGGAYEEMWRLWRFGRQMNGLQRDNLVVMIGPPAEREGKGKGKGKEMEEWVEALEQLRYNLQIILDDKPAEICSCAASLSAPGGAAKAQPKQGGHAKHGGAARSPEDRAKGGASQRGSARGKGHDRPKNSFLSLLTMGRSGRAQVKAGGACSAVGSMRGGAKAVQWASSFDEEDTMDAAYQRPPYPSGAPAAYQRPAMYSSGTDTDEVMDGGYTSTSSGAGLASSQQWSMVQYGRTMGKHTHDQRCGHVKAAVLSPIRDVDMMQVLYGGRIIGTFEYGAADMLEPTGERALDQFLGKILVTVSQFYFSFYCRA